MLFYEASEVHLIPFTFINDAEAFQLQMAVELSGITFESSKDNSSPENMMSSWH